MNRIAVLALAACSLTLSLAPESDAAQGLSAAQIVEKNVAARGGLKAWRKVETMLWIGHIESANASASALPFVLEMKRPNKTRFEIKAQNQMAVRIYDGAQGWKLRPTSSGKPELQPYTREELSFAHDGHGIDGPLMDYEAKGIAVTLDGVDEIEGHKSYRLNVKLPSGISHHVWIDAQTFLDIKYDRESRNTLGQSGTVPVFYRGYRSIDGLQMPLLIESGAGTGKAIDKMVIDRIVLNPPLEDRIFTKPGLKGRRDMVSVDTRAARPTLQRPPSLPWLASPGSRSVQGSVDTP